MSRKVKLAAHKVNQATATGYSISMSAAGGAQVSALSRPTLQLSKASVK
jgi:hypothetical protein